MLKKINNEYVISSYKDLLLLSYFWPLGLPREGVEPTLLTHEINVLTSWTILAIYVCFSYIF